MTRMLHVYTFVSSLEDNKELSQNFKRYMLLQVGEGKNHWSQRTWESVIEVTHCINWMKIEKKKQKTINSKKKKEF